MERQTARGRVRTAASVLSGAPRALSRSATAWRSAATRHTPIDSARASGCRRDRADVPRLAPTGRSIGEGGQGEQQPRCCSSTRARLGQGVCLLSVRGVGMLVDVDAYLSCSKGGGKGVCEECEALAWGARRLEEQAAVEPPRGGERVDLLIPSQLIAHPHTHTHTRPTIASLTTNHQYRRVRTRARVVRATPSANRRGARARVRRHLLLHTPSRPRALSPPSTHAVGSPGAQVPRR